MTTVHQHAGKPVLFVHQHSKAKLDAGNYPKRKIPWKGGLTISVENEAGSDRMGVNRHGVSWRQRMTCPYGEFVGTEGVDGDGVDVFVGPDLDNATHAYVVRARKVGSWDTYDEDKCIVGTHSEEEARQLFLSNYSDPRFLGPIDTYPVDDFIAKVKATRDNPGMVKAHIAGYTKKDGTVVKPHDDVRRVHAMHQHLRNITHENPINYRERLTPGYDAGIEAGGFGGTYHVSGIRSFDAGKRKGAGRRALKLLTDLADQHGVTMSLHADSYGHEGLDSDELRAWYGRHGFASPDAVDSSYMERAPQKKERLKLVLGDKMREIPLGKAEQLALFSTPVMVAGSVKKDGTVVKEYVRIQKVKPSWAKPPVAPAPVPEYNAASGHVANSSVDATAEEADAPALAPPKDVEPGPTPITIKLTPAQVSAFEINVLDPAHDDDPDAKLLRDLYRDGALHIPHDKIDAVRDALVMISNSEDVRAEAGDKMARGARDAVENLSGKVAEPSRDGETKFEGGIEYVLREGHWHRVTPLVDPRVELAEDREDLATAMSRDPHSPAAANMVSAVAEKADALAEPEPVEADDSEDTLDPSSKNYKYRDTGYIAGSRKESAVENIRRSGRTGGRLRATDIDWDEVEKNPREAKDLITKSNLFGSVDWQAMKSEGMSPAAGFLIDRVYASVSAEPAVENAQARRDYALGLETLRDRMESCKTPDDVTKVLTDIGDEIKGEMLNASESIDYKAARAIVTGMRTTYHGIREKLEAAYNQYNSEKIKLSSLEYEQDKRLRRKWKPNEELAARIATLKPEVERLRVIHADMHAADPKLKSVKRDHGNGSISYSNDYEFAIMRASDYAGKILSAAKMRNVHENPFTRAWVTLGSKFLNVVQYRSYTGSDAFATHVTSAKTGKITDWSWAETDGKAPRERGSTKGQVRFQLRVAEKFSRVGGRDVHADSTAALKAMFALRDVQSGNWVLKDVNSAAFHVQKATESFSDLADLLETPDATVSMNGRLALAFGARGQGNTGFGGAARAHYEPVQRVINITKMNGGGCLAHEWFHAMDNLVKEAEGAGVSGSDDFLTDNPDLLPPGELRDAFVELRAAMLTGDKRLPEQIEYNAKDWRTAKYNIERPYNEIAKRINAAKSVEDAVLAVDDYYRNELDRKFYSEKSRKRTEANYKRWRRLAVAYHSKDTNGEKVPVHTGRPVSSFAYEAAVLDGGTFDKYWSKRHEMAARAFQAWSEDRLAERGRKNDYLSVFADNKYYFDPLFGQSNPFPEGEERVRINAAMDKLFAVMKSKGTLAKAFSVLGDSDTGGL